MSEARTPPPPRPPDLARGVVARRDRRVGRQRSPAWSVGILLVALAIVVAADLFVLGARPAELEPTPSATTAAAVPTATQTLQPPLAATLTPTLTLAPTATPTLFLPTPTPPPTPTPQPTPIPTAPPTPTPAPTPQLSTIKYRIEDDAFLGDYNGAGSGTYHGRTATWIYGQGTPYSTMTAQFQLEQTGSATGRATLKVVGLEGADPEKQRIRIVLNGTTIFQGRDPLPNDFGSGPSGPGNWGSATFAFSADILQRNNELSITNLTDSSCTLCPAFVLVDYAVVQYQVSVGP